MAETIDRLVLFCKEMEETHRMRCKAYDDASGYTRSKNESIRTVSAAKEEMYSGYYKQLAELIQKTGHCEVEQALNIIKARMKERDKDNGGEPLNAVDRGYHLAYEHLCEEIDNLLKENKNAEFRIR